MPVTKLSIEEFLQLAKEHPVIDVRSPGEFNHAHIPGAYSLPLFSDEERKIVGTAYKQESRQKAIKHGLDFFGPKMKAMVEEVEKLFDVRCSMSDVTGKLYESHNNDQPSITNSKTLLIHCWRGGMRSGAVAWLLDLYGFKVYTLEGGYKTFRNWVLQQFIKDYPIKIIGGFTGSGKTEVLAALKNQGECVIDLEALANHKGSAFGGIGQGAQPSAEMFENGLAIQLWKANEVCDARCQQKEVRNKKYELQIEEPPTTNLQPPTIWLEDESQRIGNINIPMDFWKTMRNKEIVFLDIPFEERLENILLNYGQGDTEKLVSAVMRIKKRLGGSESKSAINFLLENDLKEAFRILLAYYDKWYLKGLHSRENLQSLVTEISGNKVDPVRNSQLILQNKRKEQNV